MISYEKFEKLSVKEKNEYLTKMRKSMKVEDIVSHWEISKSKYYAIAKEVGLNLSSKKDINKDEKKNEQTTEAQDFKFELEKQSLEHNENTNQIQNKFSISLNTKGPFNVLSQMFDMLKIYEPSIKNQEVEFKMEINEL